MNRFENISRPLMWFIALLMASILAGCLGDNGSSGGNVSVLNSFKSISSYSLAGNAGTINEPAKIIAVTVPYGTSLTALVATFPSSTYSVGVGTVPQVSGTTANDFTNSVVYTVTAADGSTAKYTVMVTVAAANAKAISAYSIGGHTGVINGTASPYSIAVNVPSGTGLTAMVASFTTSGANIKIGTMAQTSGVTTNNFNTPVAYIVTAADGTTATYNVTVTVSIASTKAITAYSLGGYTGTITGTTSPFAIAVTVPFGTSPVSLTATFATNGASINVAATPQVSGTTTNNFTSPVAYVVTATDSTTATYNVTVTVATATAKAITAYSISGINGVITGSASPFAITVTLPFGTAVTSQIATFTSTGVGLPTIGGTSQISGTTPNNFSTPPQAYLVTASDASTAIYNVTVIVAGSVSKAITAYSLSGVAGVITGSASPFAIAVNMPYGTNVASQIATFTSTGQGSPTVSAVSQISGTTVNDFAAPKAYIVTASDSSTATYNVTVTVATVAAVNLLTAGHYAILTKTGITDVPTSNITGDIGASPIAGSTIGVPCAEVTGFIYEVDATYTVGICTNIKATDSTLTQSILDMGTAYSDAFGRPAGVGAFLNLGAGTVTAQTLAPGIYTWTTPVSITGDITLNGGASDVWIFQLSQTLTTANHIILTGGAVAKNVFWQVAGAVSLGATAQFTGVILAQTNIALTTGASISGRMLAQTAVTLQANTVTQPAP